jgi:hypothetical protein
MDGTSITCVWGGGGAGVGGNQPGFGGKKKIKETTLKKKV